MRPHNEELAKMEQTLDQRRAERRKLEAELRIGQESSVSEQRLNEPSANRVTFSSCNCQLIE